MHYLDLPESTRLSLLRGFVERAWRAAFPPEAQKLAHAQVADEVAHRDGLRLRAALDALLAAEDFDELNAAEAAYDELARELDERYGNGLVVLSHEDDELGIRGFRGQGVTTRSSVLMGEERVAG